MLFYRIYQCLVMVPLVVLWTIITALFTMLLCFLGLGRWAGYWPQVLWARVFCWLAFVRVSVKGRDLLKPSTSYVFVANHQGAYDIFAIYGYLGHNFRWMMKQSLRKIPFVGIACQVSKQIFVDRKSVSGVKSTMKSAESLLRSGMSIVVFPEGQRTPDGRMTPFRKGAYKLAMEFSLPVVPLSIDGSYSVMPRQARLPRPGHIVLTIHEPIFPPKGGYDLPQLMQQTRDDIASSLPEKNR